MITLICKAMSKITAVEWLIGELNGYDEDCEIFQIAKAMERQQIRDAYYSSMLDCQGGKYKGGMGYYNETYKGGEQ